MAVDTVSISVHPICANGRSVAAMTVCEIDWDHLRRIIRCRVAVGVWTHFLLAFGAFSDVGTVDVSRSGRGEKLERVGRTEENLCSTKKTEESLADHVMVS